MVYLKKEQFYHAETSLYSVKKKMVSMCLQQINSIL